MERKHFRRTKRSEERIDGGKDGRRKGLSEERMVQRMNDRKRIASEERMDGRGKGASEKGGSDGRGKNDWRVKMVG